MAYRAVHPSECSPALAGAGRPADDGMAPETGPAPAELALPTWKGR